MSGKNTPASQGKANGGDSNSLVGSVDQLRQGTENALGEQDGDGVIGKFGELGDTIAEAESHVTGVIDGLNKLDGMSAECTITVNIETVGGIPEYASGTAIDHAVGAMDLSSSTHKAKYSGNAHVEGTALASGNWAVQSDEQSALVGEEGFEIIVRNGRFFTVGNTGAEMTDIKKGDIVFNHEQSVNLLKNGHISGRGKAYADGTVGGGKILTKDGQILRPLQPGDKVYDMVQKFDAYFKRIDGNIEKLVPSSYYEYGRQMDQLTNHITNISNVTNNKNVQPVVNNIHVTCPGVTSQQVAEQIGSVLGKELDKQFSGFHNYTDQMSRIR